MTKHTPGPWNQIVYAGDQHTSIVNSDKTHIAAVNKKNDAALINAAPELLAALVEMYALYADHEQYDEEGYETAAINAARAAIAKATYQQGQTQ